MLNSLSSSTALIIMVLVGIIAGFFLLTILPTAAENPLFLAALPVGLIFLIIMVIDIKVTVILLLFMRALLDPFLNMTKLNLGVMTMGMGGVINLIIIMLGLFLMLRNPSIMLKNKLNKWWIFFLVVYYIAVTNSPVKSSAIKIFLGIFTHMCVFIMPFYFLEKARDKDFWLKILLYSTFLPVIMALLDLTIGFRYSEYLKERVVGTFSHPNILAFYLLFAIIITFVSIKGHVFGRTTLRKNALRSYLIILFVLLFATETRNAWISCWLIFFIYGLLCEKQYLFYTLAFIPVALIIPALRERVMDLFQGTDIGISDELNSFSWRMELWISSFQLIKKRIFFGHGVASFPHLTWRFFRLAQKAEPHNVYVELLFETGLIGLIAYLAIFFNILKGFFIRFKNSFLERKREYAIAISFVIGYLLICFADNMLDYLVMNWYVWFFLGVMVKAIDLPETEESP